MSRAQRIAFLSPRFAAGATVGGAETLLRRLAEHAAAAGREVGFLATCADNHFTWENTLPAGEERHGALTVRRFPVDARDARRFLRVQGRIDRREQLTAADEAEWLRHSVNSTALLDHLARTPYDRIVAGPYLFGLVIETVRRFPDRTILLPCLHDEPFAYLETVRTMFRSAGGLIFNSEPEQALAQKLYALPAEAGQVVGMGMDPFEADPHAFAQSRRLTAPYVIYSGRREPLKGTPLFLEYMDLFRRRTGRDIRIVLTGSGEIQPPPGLEPYLLDAGFLSESDKHAAMGGAVAFVHPSRLESFGIVILEALLARTPALVHAGSAVLAELCRRSQGGLWFRHYPDFEEELLLLLDQPDLRRQLGQAGHDYVAREYNWAAVDARLLAALDRPVASAP